MGQGSGCNELRGTATEVRSKLCPPTPAQLSSSRPPLMLGLPPPSFPPLTLARVLLWTGEVCDATKLRAAFPHVTKSSSSCTSLPWPLLTLQEGRNLGAAGHPLRLL